MTLHETTSDARILQSGTGLIYRTTLNFGRRVKKVLPGRHATGLTGLQKSGQDPKKSYMHISRTTETSDAPGR
jgi:hypothetical protein